MQNSTLKPQLRLVQPLSQPTPAPAADFATQLAQFSAHPESPVIERRFAARLLTTRMFALVQVDTQKHLATTTYLADGARYLPVFTTRETLATFIEAMACDLLVQPELMTTQDLMQAAQTYQLNGLLIDPGSESLPVSQSYWRYINRVMPVIDPDLAQVTFADADLDLAPLLARLASGLSGVDDIAQLWLAGVRLTPDDSLCLAVIADYRGFALTFDTDIAPSLAAACQPLLPSGVDVLCGTLQDDFGRLVAAADRAATLNQA